MDAEHKQFLDYQANNVRLGESELELDLMLSSAILGADPETLSAWNPYGRVDVLRGIRSERLSELSIILFDLDGCADWPDDSRKQEQLFSLVREARQTMGDAILGLPSIYTVMDRDDNGAHKTHKAMMIEHQPRCDIVVPEEVYNAITIEPLAGISDITKDRFEWLDYKRWHLHEKGIIAQAFLDFLAGAPASPAPGTSWIVDAITDAVKDAEHEETEHNNDPVKEVLYYLQMIKELGWCGNVKCEKMEKVLIDIARRISYTD